MKKKILIGLIIAVIIFIVIFILTREKENPYELTLYGNIEIRQVDLSFLVSGKIDKMYKEEGDKVEPGELMATLDSRDYEADLAKANADMQKALALKNDAESDFKRQAPLADDNTISKLEYDNLFNAKNKAIAEYNAAVATKDLAQNRYDDTKIYAKEEGIVTVRVQEPGAIVNKGQTVYTVSKTKPVWIRAYVNETDLGNIKYAMKVKVYTDTVNPQTGTNREYEGYIGYISPVAEFTPKTVQSTDLRTDLVYRIRVYIEDIDEYLRQGMPTTIKIDLKSEEENAGGKN